MLINGQPGTTVAIADRGLAYGDGLFETIRFHQRRLVLGPAHLARLRQGCERLQLPLDFAALEQETSQALALADADDGVLKLLVTRGAGGRGYRAGQLSATRIITVHPLPDYGTAAEQGIRAFVCRQRLAAQPALAGLKHLNRLEQVLASLEWPDESFAEGLMLDMQERVIEGTRSNVFLVSGERLLTPGLEQCGVEGVLRNALLAHFGQVAGIASCTLAQLREADEVFFCNSVFGVWPLGTLVMADATQHWQPGPRTREAQALFQRILSA